jgi:hypothetical protein
VKKFKVFIKRRNSVHRVYLTTALPSACFQSHPKVKSSMFCFSPDGEIRGIDEHFQTFIE